MESSELESNTPNINIKTIEIQEGHNQYKCQIQIIKHFLQVTLYLQEKLKYEGNIPLQKIQNQICAFIDCNISEIFEEINELNNEKFIIINDLNKLYLNIEFIIFKKKKNLMINLFENENIEKNDLIKNISELKEIIKAKEEKIKALEDELRHYKDVTNNNSSDNSYNNFDIKLKEPIHKLKYHTDRIYCATTLKDGRFATGSTDNSIIIYNKNTYQPDITIKEHSGSVCSLTQLSSGILASGSSDNTIKLFNINNNQYNVLKTLSSHTNSVYKEIELNNKKLVSCSYDQSFIE